jgi:tetratricopeptide (TPR) repeat protein
MFELDAVIAAADSLEDNGDLLASEKKWRDALQLEARPDIGARLGRNLMLQNRLNEAEEVLKGVLASHPDAAEPLFVLGLTKKEQNELSAARDALTQALSFRDWPEARIILGEVQRQLGNVEAAREQLELALRSDPSNNEGWYTLGLTYRTADPQHASELFRKAIASDPTHAAAYRELGFALTQASELDEAVVQLKTALSIDSTDVWAHCYLGACLKKLRRLAEAEVEYRKAIELMPQEPLFWCSLGDVQALGGQWDAAEQSYLHALSIDIGDYLSNLRFGQFLNRRGFPNRAITYLQRALSADPDNLKIQELLRGIQQKQPKV